MTAHFPMEQFVSPAEVRRARRMEERGLWSAEQYLQDLVMGRIIRLTCDHHYEVGRIGWGADMLLCWKCRDCGQRMPMTDEETASVARWNG